MAKNASPGVSVRVSIDRPLIAAGNSPTRDACIAPAITDRAFPREKQANRSTLGYGEFDTGMKVVAEAVEPGPYLMGDQFTAADVVVGSTLRWGMMFDLVPKGPEFVAYGSRLEQRPALQRATALDRELAQA